MVAVDEARQHIDRIYADYASGPTRLQSALEGALRTVQKGFSREGHYLFEFIQNADDARAQAVAITLRERQVEIANDGEPFTAADVDALCTVGHSGKRPEGYIGYLGVGFKSVFLISDRPQVVSGPYRFAFSRPPEGDAFPWQVAPVWLAEAPATAWHTLFTIPLRSEAVAERMSAEMGSKSLDRRVLLFLQSVRRLEIADERRGARRVVTCTRQDDIVKLEETGDGQSVRERWLTFESVKLPIPEHVRADPQTQVWDRDQATHRAITLAFKLGEDGLLERVAGTLHTGVFSYLPLREERTRLRFIVHADFLTAIGRTRVQDRTAWNDWLAEQIVLLIKRAAGELLAHPQRRQRGLSVLWPARPDASDFFAEHVERPVTAFLEEEVELPAFDGSFVRPRQALVVADPALWEVVGPEALEQLYGRRPLARELELDGAYPSSHILQRAPSLIGNTRQEGFLSTREGECFLRERAAQGDVARFKQAYAHIAAPGWTPKSYQGSPLARTPLVLTSTGTLAQPGEVHLKPKDLPASLEGVFHFVHPALAEDPEARPALALLGVQELSAETVRQVLAKRDLPAIRERWPDLAPAERHAELVRLRLWVEQGHVRADEVRAFVTLPAKPRAPASGTVPGESGSEWLPPGQLLFGEEFSPDHNIEPLVRAGFLDDPSIRFLSADLAPTPERPAWRRFLERIGVGSPLHDEARLRRWAKRVGVLVARWYEEREGRKDIHEVTEAEAGVSVSGYDLRARTAEGGQTRFVEAKGTRGDGEFVLRPTTRKQMLLEEKRDRFYVYVTTGALSAPRLHILGPEQLTAHLLIAGDLVLHVRRATGAEVVQVPLTPQFP